ncbi:MAG TPA: GNAT family N-acetyltransferase [Rugosimonospora sp.]|nr:GNAT family N-acetyltransferase [Rugosimonospora sp.]
MRVRLLHPADPAPLAAAFGAAGWPGRSTALYQRYLGEQSAGSRVVWLAEHGAERLGYVCVLWRSEYPPFRNAGIPEIVDFTVLPAYRRRGVGTALMDAAEYSIAERSDRAGLGCGLYADYGPAMLLYLARGYRPDGRGVTYDRRTVAAGQSIRLDDSAALMLVKELHPGR